MKTEKNLPGSVGGMTLKFSASLLMALLLSIPLYLIERTASEREFRYLETQADFNEQFGGDIDLDVALAGDYTNAQGDRMTFYGEPSVSRIDGDLRHQRLKRGRYDVLSHTTKLDLHIEGGIANVLKGADNITYHLDKSSIRVIVYNHHDNNYYLNSKATMTGDSILVDQQIEIAGGGYLSFTARGDFRLGLRGDWGSPDLAVGNLSATSRQITKKGFNASWQSSVKGDNTMWSTLNDYTKSSIRVARMRLVVDVSQYQMTERTIKYGMLVIVLTFVAFLLTEMLFRWPINLIQYLLSGLALVLFYSLLLSLSEYMHFNVAYAVSTGLTLGMVFLYIRSIFSRLAPALTIVGMLIGLYAYIYVLTQLVEYALIAGSLGLFVILGLIMYVSQRLFSRLSQEKKAATPNTSATPPAPIISDTSNVLDKKTEEI